MADACPLGDVQPCSPVELRVRHRLMQSGTPLPAPTFAGDLVIAEPFIGLGGTRDVMEEWEVGYKPTNVYDTQPGLRELHIAKHGLATADTFDLGSREGDMMAVPLVALEASHGVVAGPPCPPWSPIGPKRKREDARVDPFDRLLAWLRSLYVRGLLFFIIENVTQIFSPDQGGQSYGDQVVSFLLEQLPAFRFRIVRLQCAPDLLPQRRLRVWIIGMRKDTLMGHDSVPEPLSLSGIPAVQLADILSTDEANVPQATLTPARRSKLIAYEKRFKCNIERHGLRHLVAVFDIDRGLHCQWTPVIGMDVVPTLTCSNSTLFVTSLPDIELPAEERMYCRFLTPGERFLLQGHQPSLTRRVSRERAISLSGNAFPVPMLSCVMGPVLQRLSSSGIVGRTVEASILSPLQLQALADEVRLSPAIAMYADDMDALKEEDVEEGRLL